MLRARSLFMSAAALALAANAASAVVINYAAGPTFTLPANTAADVGTLTNVDLAGNRVVVIDAVIARTEFSGGDSWLSFGVNSAGGVFDVPLNGDIGVLTRTRTDGNDPHQLFDVPAGTTQNSPNDPFRSFVRTRATFTLPAAGIAAGQPVNVTVQYDDDNNGTIDATLGGTFNLSQNFANLDVSANNKNHLLSMLVRSATSTSELLPLQAITGLYNTGVDNNGVALGDDVDDPHYQIIVNPSGLPDSTVPNDGFPIGPWAANDGNSRWIGPNDSGNDAVGPAGSYTYRTTFTLHGDADLTTAAITGLWGADDGSAAAEILLNGVVVSTGNGGFGALTPFLIGPGSPFVAGINTLDFRFNNAGGPTGLRVDEMTGTFSLRVIPEPGSLALVGLGGLALLRRRRVTA